MPRPHARPRPPTPASATAASHGGARRCRRAAARGRGRGARAQRRGRPCDSGDRQVQGLRVGVRAALCRAAPLPSPPRPRRPPRLDQPTPAAPPSPAAPPVRAPRACAAAALPARAHAPPPLPRPRPPSCYDIIHGGHVEFFRTARALGDYLIVSVAGDAVLAAHKAGRPPSMPTAHKARAAARAHGLGLRPLPGPTPAPAAAAATRLWQHPPRPAPPGRAAGRAARRGRGRGGGVPDNARPRLCRRVRRARARQAGGHRGRPVGGRGWAAGLPGEGDTPNARTRAAAWRRR